MSPSLNLPAKGLKRVAPAPRLCFCTQSSQKLALVKLSPPYAPPASVCVGGSLPGTFWKNWTSVVSHWVPLASFQAGNEPCPPVHDGGLVPTSARTRVFPHVVGHVHVREFAGQFPGPVAWRGPGRAARSPEANCRPDSSPLRLSRWFSQVSPCPPWLEDSICSAEEGAPLWLI